MECSIAYRDGILEAKARGDAEYDGVKRMIADIVSHPRWMPGGAILVDYTEFNGGPITVAEVRSLAHAVGQIRDRFGRAKCAHLVAGDLEFGLVRMWESFVLDRWDGRAMCFRSRPEAMSWLTDSDA